MICGFYYSDVIIVKSVAESIIELKSIQNTYDKWDLETSKYYFYFSFAKINYEASRALWMKTWPFRQLIDGQSANKRSNIPQ